MSTALLLCWILVGWCGTVPRTWPPQPPEPEPWSSYLMARAIAVVGGVVGGLLFSQLFPAQATSAADVAVSLIGAFAGGRLASDIGSRLLPGSR